MDLHKLKDQVITMLLLMVKKENVIVADIEFHLMNAQHLDVKIVVHTL